MSVMAKVSDMHYGIRVMIEDNDGKYSIMIVDDEEGIIELLEDEFDTHGYKVTTSMKVLEGIEKLNKEFDAILADLKMPDGGGTAILKEVNKMEAIERPLFFFISGKHKDDEGEKFDIEGATDFFTKSATLDLTEVADQVTASIKKVRGDRFGEYTQEDLENIEEFDENNENSAQKNLTDKLEAIKKAQEARDNAAKEE